MESSRNIQSAAASKKVKEGFIGQKMIVLPPNIKRLVVKNDLTKRFYLTAVGFYPHADFHDRERKFGSSQYILLYCVEGSGRIELQGKTIELYPNSYYIIPKNVPHHYKASPEDPWTIYWVHFIGETGDFLFQRYIENNNGTNIPYNESRIRSFEEIVTLLENSFETRELEIVNIKLLDLVSSFIYYKEINPSYQEDDVVSDSIIYMKKNLHKQFSVPDLAAQQHLSVTQYSRLFRHKTGCSPNQYFSQLKVQKSCQYLYFSDRSIKEICTELGFDDPYYFSRLFKKLMGMSPAKYKSQQKTNK